MDTQNQNPEENKVEKAQSKDWGKIASIILACFIVSMLVGIRVYNSYLKHDLENMVRENTVIDENGHLSYQPRIPALTKTYNQFGVKFKYPEHFTAEHEIDENGFDSFTVEDDGEDITQLLFNYFEFPLIETYTKEQRKEMLNDVVEGGVSAMRDNNYGSFLNLKVTKTGFLDDKETSYASYTFKLAAIEMTGTLYSFFSGNKVVTLVVQSENQKGTKTLENIVKTIEFY